MVGNGGKWIKSIFADNGIIEQGFDYLFINCCISHFFNKTDFKLNLFKQVNDFKS